MNWYEKKHLYLVESSSTETYEQAYRAHENQLVSPKTSYLGAPTDEAIKDKQNLVVYYETISAETTTYTIVYRSTDGNPVTINETSGWGSVILSNTYGEYGVITFANFPPTAVPSGAFTDETNLLSITIPSTITEVGSEAFSGCTSLREIAVEASTAPTITQNGDTFTGVKKYGTLIYPEGSDYSSWFTQGLEKWNCPKIVATFETSLPGEQVKLATSDVVYLEIDGVVQEPIVYTYTFATSGEHTVRYVVESNVSPVMNTFKDCVNMTTAYVPYMEFETATYSSNPPISMFEGCTALENVILDGCSMITADDFKGCTSLTSVSISNTVSTVAGGSFCGCTSLESIVIPDSVTTINNSAFRGCTSLEHVKIGSGLTTMTGSYIFYGCSVLRDITIDATTEPSVSQTTFQGIAQNGILTFPSGSSYNTWLDFSQYYLGYYGWSAPIDKTGQAGTIVLSKDNQLYYCYYEDYVAEDWTDYIKEGVIVAPASHFPDDKARMISLNGLMDNLGRLGTIEWGPNGNVSGLDYYDFPTWSNNLESPNYNMKDYAYSPSNAFTSSTVLYANDNRLKYISSITAHTDRMGLSPYLSDDSLDPSFRSGITGYNNAFSDIDGYGNTNILIGLSGYSAANLCHNFTNGNNGGMFTTPGTWYLPACGELVYMIPKSLQISSALMSVYGKEPFISNGIWSSTEKAQNSAIYINIKNGTTNYYAKSLNYTEVVIPFTKI